MGVPSSRRDGCSLNRFPRAELQGRRKGDLQQIQSLARSDSNRWIYAAPISARGWISTTASLENLSSQGCLTGSRLSDKDDLFHRFSRYMQEIRGAVTTLTARELPSPHLEPKAPPVDLACPGLMLAANASLVLGYLWIDWVSNDHGVTLSAIRGVLLPAFIALAIFALRPACTRRRLPGSVVALPVTAALVLACSVAAVATYDRPLALTAGSSALLLGLAAFGSVMLREASAASSLTSKLHLFARGAGTAQ